MTHYIYIPGFNDWFDPFRRLALLRWCSRTTRTTLVAMKWSNRTETYEQKYARVAKAIDRIGKDEEIILVGESAGGAMALLGFARNIHRVKGVVTVCGYNYGSADIGTGYRKSKPAFYDTSRQAEEVIKAFSPDIRRRITTLYSTADEVVTPSHTRIEDAQDIALSPKGHLESIFYVLLTSLEKVIQEASY